MLRLPPCFSPNHHPIPSPNTHRILNSVHHRHNNAASINCTEREGARERPILMMSSPVPEPHRRRRVLAKTTRKPAAYRHTTREASGRLRQEFRGPKGLRLLFKCGSSERYLVSIRNRGLFLVVLFSQIWKIRNMFCQK